MTETQATLLCPIDFSEGAQPAVDQAARMAKLLGAQVELFHAFEVPMLSLPDGGWMVGPDVIEALTNRCLDLLEKQAEALRAQGVHVNTRLEQGPAAQTITSRASVLKAVMIVIGTHGYTGIKHALMGSVAERIVRTADVPVLTVRLAEPKA